MDDIRALLTQTRTWAVVGCSPDPGRDSHRVAALLRREGFRVIPVNPNVDGELLGERCYARLDEIEEPVDVVDIFRRADRGRRARRRGDRDRRARRVDAARRGRRRGGGRARAAGLRVVMDRCPAIELPSDRPLSPLAVGGVRERLH